MKSTKICNILMLIVNLFNILISIGVVINNDIVTTGVTVFSANIIGDFILWSHSLVIPICNFLMFIINIKNKKLRFVYLILSIYDLGSLLVLLNICEDYEDIIIGIIISIIILIHNLINFKGKKRIICSIVTIVLAIICVLWLNKFYAYIQMLILVVFAILIIKEPIDEIIGIRKILSIIVICISFVCVILFFIGDKIVEKETMDLVKKVQQYVQSANTSTGRYIPICKNGKWGYVDNKGNVKIDYQYDKASMMGEVSLENDKEHLVNIALVKQNDKYMFIGENNDEIINFKMRSNIENDINRMGTFDNYISSSLGLGFIIEVLENIENSNTINTEKLLKIQYISERNTYYENKYKTYQEILPNNDGNYEFQLNGKTNIIRTKQKQRKENQSLYNGYKIEHQYNDLKYIISNGSQEKEININLEENEDGIQVLKLYSNGYIPYCDIDNKIQGYYDENFNLKTIKGNYQILDIKDGYIIMRQFDEKNEQIGIIVLDKNNKIIKKFKQITTIENRYVVKKDNDKIVFLDNNFNEISDEYDYIDSVYVDGIFDVYIAGKKEESTTKYYMLDVANLQVISQDIEQFVGLYDRDDKELQEKYCQGYYALDYIYNINNYN